MDVKDIPLRAILTMYIMGICTLLPWNFFITADSYWQYKLRNTTLGDEWDAPESSLTGMQVAFTPSLVIIANVAAFIFMFFTSAISKSVQEKTRILSALVITSSTMAIVTSLSIVNTDEWQKIFFEITLVLVALINVGTAVLQASMFGMVGSFPSYCISAYGSGLSIAGIVSSLSQIISLAIGNQDPVTTGIIYFCFADVFILFSMYSYLSFRKMKFYKANINEVKNEKGNELSWKEYLRVFKKIFWMGFTYGFTLLVTLSVYPSVSVYVTSIHSSSTWADVYFQPTVTFLLFNVSDMIGRELSKWIQWPGHRGCLFHILGACRVLFIPLILLCHGENKEFPTLFHYDFYYIIINFLFALSNGYFSALSMVYYPRFVEKEETELAGTLVASIMSVGIVLGSLISPGFVVVWGPNKNN